MLTYRLHAIIIENVDDEYILDAENVDSKYIIDAENVDEKNILKFKMFIMSTIRY